MKILEAELIASAPRVEKLPRSGLPEIAFLGRSNVGKSSLLNALARRRKLARTSSTPGKTRELVLFRVRTDRGEVGLVDRRRVDRHVNVHVSQVQEERGSDIYVPVELPDKTKNTALDHIVNTFFGGSTPSAVSALLDADLSQDELNELAEMIEKAKQTKEDGEESA